MSLFSYFQRVNKPSDVASQINYKDGLVTENEVREVTKALRDKEQPKEKRGKCNKWTDEQRGEIFRMSSCCGVSAAIKKLKVKYPNLSKQTVSDFKKAYDKAKLSTNTLVDALPDKKRGRPALMPEDLMAKTIEIIESMRIKGAPISANVINSIGKGVVMANDRCILVENGGYLIGQNFVQNFVRRILLSIFKKANYSNKNYKTTSLLLSNKYKR